MRTKVVISRAVEALYFNCLLCEAPLWSEAERKSGRHAHDCRMEKCKPTLRELERVAFLEKQYDPYVHVVQ